MPLDSWQYEELCLQYDIALLKLERDLLQAYINRGEMPEEKVVEMKVEETAQTFNENIHREEEKIKEAKAYISQHAEENSKQKDAEKIELKKIYKRLVHRLHPDLHPEQTEWERELFLLDIVVAGTTQLYVQICFCDRSQRRE